MKLLLISGGTTQEISAALLELVGKPFSETSLAFIPTAANVEEGDKEWLINDLTNLNALKMKCIDIVDISALSSAQWRPRLEAADVLFFGGGNTYHLMEWLQKSGLDALLSELLKTRVYAGISAGSMVTGKKLMSHADQIYYEDTSTFKNMDGLGFVDFTFKPHLDSPYFPKAREENIREIAKIIPGTIYALDDQGALKVVDGKIDVVGGGKCVVFNQ